MLQLILPIVRHLAQVVGGYLLAKGMIDEGAVEQFSGLAISAVSLIWMIVVKLQAKKETATTPAILLPFLLAAGLTTGCATAERTTYIATGTVVRSVEAAMFVWGDYVKAGNATQEEIDRITSIYTKYQKVFRVEMAIITSLKENPNATKADWLKALDAISAASDEVIEAISEFIPTIKQKTSAWNIKPLWPTLQPTYAC